MTHFADEESTAALLGGRYLLHECIGQGAMARVFRADDVILGRPVAVKMMRETPDGTAPAPRARTEMALLASLNHPSLVTLYDAMVEPGQPEYLVMELIEGRSLADALRDGPMAADDAAVLATELAGALHIVHAAGIVHRDIKPSNVLMATDPIPGRRPRAKLADFGVALLAGSERLTSPGMVVGTAAYLAPEQVRGAAPAPPADIYALGLVLREALTGERAYPDATGIGAVMARLVESPALPDWIGPEWTALLTAMLSPEPIDRPCALDVVSAATTLPTNVTAPPPPPAVLPPLPPLPATLGGPAAAPAAPPVPTVALPVATSVRDTDDALSVFDALREPDPMRSAPSTVPAAVAASDASAQVSATGVVSVPITRRQHRVPRRARSRTRMVVLLGAALAAVAILGVNAATWVGSLSGGPGTATLRELPTNAPTDDGVVATSEETVEPIATVVDAPDEGGDKAQPATAKKPTDKAAQKAQREAEKAAKKAERDAEKTAREAEKKQRDEQRRSAPAKGKGGPGKGPGNGNGQGDDNGKGKGPGTGSVSDADAVQLAVAG